MISIHVTSQQHEQPSLPHRPPHAVWEVPLPSLREIGFQEILLLGEDASSWKHVAGAWCCRVHLACSSVERWHGNVW